MKSVRIQFLSARRLTAKLALVVLLTPMVLPAAYANSKTHHLEDELSDAKKDQREKTAAEAKARNELPSARAAAAIAQSELGSWQASHPADSLTTADQRELLRLKQEARDKAARRDALQSAYEQAKSDAAQAKEETKEIARRLDRAEEEESQPKKEARAGTPPGGPDSPKGLPNGDCPDGTCGRKNPSPASSKSGLENLADVIKAVTPLGLGAMNLYGSVKAINTQSSDYQLYASTMAANGLPFSQNTNGYSGILSSMTGTNNMLSMMSTGGGGIGSMGGMGGLGMMGGMGMGMGSVGSLGGYTGFGAGMNFNPYALGGGFNPYSSYGSNNPSSFSYGGSYYPYSSFASYSPYGNTYSGYSYSNPWFSNSYGYNSYGAQARSSQQNAILSQDAQVASQALSDAQSRYYQTLGQFGGVSNSYGYGASSTNYNPYQYYGSYGAYGTGTGVNNRQ